MIILKPSDEKILRQQLKDWMKKQFGGEIEEYKKLFDKFAPDYVISKERKKTAVFFREPPDLPPKIFENDVNLCMARRIPVYVAVYDHEQEILLKKLFEAAYRSGIGVIHCDRTGKINCLLRSRPDWPAPEKIVEGRVKVFVSSKLFVPEREHVRRLLLNLKHQPILVERVVSREKVHLECFKWIEKSDFFVGIITEHSKIIEREIRHAFKKRKSPRMIVYINNSCSSSKSMNLARLIKFVEANCTYHYYGSTTDLSKDLPAQVSDMIKKHLITK